MLAEFALLLIAGIAGMLCLTPRQQVASGFFRVQSLVLLGLSVLLGMTSPTSVVAGILIGIAAFAGSALWMLERRKSGTGAIVFIAIVALAEIFRLNWGREPSSARALWILSQLATAGTLGGTLTGMLLGHRYLTAPGMPLRPLYWLNGLLGAAVALRLIVSAASLVWGSAPPVESVAGIWLLLRWLAGIIGPAVAVILVWRILRYRNTQSATGVLFGAVVLAFIGELSAALLSRTIDWPM